MKQTFLILLVSSLILHTSSLSSSAGKTNIVVSVGSTATNAIPAKNWSWLFIYCADSPFHVSVNGIAATDSPRWPAGSAINFTGGDGFAGSISFIRSGSSNMTVHAIGESNP
jgi:hypothetical protein